MNLSLSHIIVAVAFVAIGVVFSGYLRALPGVSMLPKY